MNTKELIEKAKACKSKEELVDVAKNAGIVLSDEEAQKYYDSYHKTGELSDEELDNVAGGSCYSSNSHHFLITTWGNTCDGFEANDMPFSGDGSCLHCTNSFMDGITTYCKIRTKENDPYA